MSLLSLGINHQTAPVDIREKVAFAPEQMGRALVELQEFATINESVIVSTCNRTEIYCDTSSESGEAISHWLCDYHGMSSEALSPYIYQYNDQEVARHLFRVASPPGRLCLASACILRTNTGKLPANTQFLF